MKQDTGNSDIGRTLVHESISEGRSCQYYSDGSVKAASSQGWLDFRDVSSFEKYHLERTMSHQTQTPKTLLGRLAGKLRF